MEDRAAARSRQREENPDVCEVCGGDTDDDRDTITGLDGATSHVVCLEAEGVWDRAPRDDDA